MEKERRDESIRLQAARNPELENLVRDIQLRLQHQHQHQLQRYFAAAAQFGNLRQLCIADVTGLKWGVCQLIAAEAALGIDEVYAVYAYMYNSGCWANVVLIMSYFFPDGAWSRRTTMKKVAAAARKIAQGMQRKWLSPWTSSPNLAKHYDFQGLMDQQYQLALDTVPIGTYNREVLKLDSEGSEHMLFQPKYAHAVMKVLVVCTMRGFVVYVSEPFQGSVSDSTIYQQFVHDFQMRHRWKLGNAEVKALADCAFPNCPHLLRPWRGPQIWPNGGDPTPPQTELEYLRAGNRKLVENERVAHFRSRIEHQFAAPMFNRWRIFRMYRGKCTSVLHHCVKAAFICLNAEAYLNAGENGRYEEYDARTVRRVRNKIEVHMQQNSRYPRAKAKAKKEKRLKKKNKKPNNQAAANANEKKKKGRPCKATKNAKDAKREIENGTQKTLDYYAQKKDETQQQ
jgi:hypothetical protein